MRLASSVAATVLSFAIPAAAQTATTPSAVPVTLSSVPMIRNADLALAAAVLATSGTDAIVERAWPGTLHDDGPKGRVVRAVKLAAFDWPVVLYFVALNHELGHLTRANEKGYRSQFNIVGTPWSGNPFELSALDYEIFHDMGSQVGGEEGSRRLKDQAESAMRGAERIAAGHALAVIISSLDLPIYAYWNLAPDKFDFAAGRPFPDGDIGLFVSLLAIERGQSVPVSFDTTRRHVRARSMLNLLDSSLWTLTYGVFHDHVWKGEDGVRVRWLRVGRAAFIPSLRYDVTPIGPEYAIRSHYRVLHRTGLGYVRWSEPIGAARQAGAGLSMAGWQVRGLRPQVTADLWSHTTNGAGIHGALGVELVDWPSHRATFTMTAGAKSSGYLPGFPMESGPYVKAGFNVKPW